VLLVVMGVSGSGKTTTGQALAQRLNWTFLDADTFHPPANIAKMSAGQPLDDVDRAPWLDALVDWVYLRVPREVLAARLSERIGHFFPPILLESQLAVLEEPAPEEGVLTLDGLLPPEVLVDSIVDALSRG
jgi:gluconate kinase